ncbi:MAG: hypothetical protein J6Z27_04365 [Bacteroidales bacterium]|nr:hypothetical protein [Bacteroidales bacterium]
MKFFRIIICIAAGMALSLSVYAQNQNEGQNQPPEVDYGKQAEEQANGLGQEFNLDYAQIFKVDTLYQRVLPLFFEEMNTLQQRGFQNTDFYQQVADRWNDYIDTVLESIFTADQWKKYMKSPYGKEKQRRDKRIEQYNSQVK